MSTGLWVRPHPSMWWGQLPSPAPGTHDCLMESRDTLNEGVAKCTENGRCLVSCGALWKWEVFQFGVLGLISWPDESFALGVGCCVPEWGVGKWRGQADCWPRSGLIGGRKPDPALPTWMLLDPEAGMRTRVPSSERASWGTGGAGTR